MLTTHLLCLLHPHAEATAQPLQGLKSQCLCRTQLWSPGSFDVQAYHPGCPAFQNTHTTFLMHFLGRSDRARPHKESTHDFIFLLTTQLLCLLYPHAEVSAHFLQDLISVAVFEHSCGQSRAI